MTTTPQSARRCPNCARPMTLEQKTREANPWYPFCSNRCKMADLARWFRGDYAISQNLGSLTPEQRDELPDLEDHSPDE